jgi:CRP-like cAMP-binding protein
MAKNVLPRRRKGTLQPLRRDGDGNQIRNEILLDLPQKEYEAVLAKLEFTRLKPHQVMHEAGDTLRSGYFCNTGLVSVLSVMPDGRSVEVGMMGKEGFVGLPLIAGFRSSSIKTVAPIEGTAFRIPGEALMGILHQCPVLERKLRQFSQIFTMQVMQVAACNRLHEVEERLARWLLMSQDRIGSKSLALTQELLGQILGTRRSSVSTAAGTLQRAGLIACRRGGINILKRRNLEDAACDCYAIMQRLIKDWGGEPK